MENNYFIKPGYKPFKNDSNDLNLTLDENREFKYWDKSRIRLSYNYQWHVYDFAKNYTNSKSKVLDIGCGTAHKLINILGSFTQNISGIDQKDSVNYCKKTHAIGTFIVDDFEKSSISGLNDVDLLLCVDVIEHMFNPDILLNYIKKNSDQKTKIIISTPDRDRLRGFDCMESKKPEHIREWNFQEFKNYIENSGLIIEKHFHCLPMRLSLSNIIEYCNHFLTQRIGRKKGKQFAYNQVVVCKLS